MRHFLNGTEITPLNYDKIGLSINYGDPANFLAISTDSITLVNEGYEIAMNHLFNGVGASEGIPYQIVTESNPPQTLEYFVDFTEDHLIKDNSIDCKLKKRYSNQAFFQQANGMTFTNLASKGVVFPTIETPYVIIKQNQLEQGITLALTTFAMKQSLEQAIKDTSVLIADFISAIGTDISDAISAGLKLAAHLIYTAAIIIALIKLAQQVRELLFPKIRYFKSCKIKDLIKIGVENLDIPGGVGKYTLSSSLLDSISNEAICPVPIIRNKKSILQYLENDLNFAFNYGYPTAMDTTPTLGSLIDAIMLKNNARTTVVDGMVRIERRDYQFNSFSGLNPALAIQGERSDGFQLNTNEMYKRSYVHYLVDYNDFHTLNKFEQTDCEDSTEQININNHDLVMIKGMRDVAIPFAFGVRKDELSLIENIALGVFQFMDALASLLGFNSNFAALINNRIGVLQIGEQFFTQTKLLYLINGKQPKNYLDYIGARAIYNNFHAIDEISKNDFIAREQVNCVIDSDDFVLLQQSNYAEIDGKNCELLKVDFFDQQSKANVTYKEPFHWASNLKNVAIDG